MADIFISYARADRPRAQRLAQALGQQGWSVWWDREIPPGKSFDEVIEEALSAAKCVIVIWSAESVKSEWVKAEASEAFKLRILVPILADDAKIPLEFRRLQAAQLSDWDSLPDNPDWGHLEEAVARLVGRAAASPRKETSPAQRVPVRARFDRRLVAAAAAVVIVSTAAVIYLRDGAVPSVANAMPMSEVSFKRPESVSVSEPAVPSTPSVEPEEPLRQPVAPVRSAMAPRTINPPNEQRTIAHAIPAPVASLPLNDATISLPSRAATVEAAVDTAPPAIVSNESTFKVTRNYGVYRDQAGLLTVSSGGLSYRDVTSSRDGFDVPCGDVRKVAALNVIADQEQRTVELSLRDRSYRFKTQRTTERDGLMAALSRVCGTR